MRRAKAQAWAPSRQAIGTRHFLPLRPETGAAIQRALCSILALSFLFWMRAVPTQKIAERIGSLEERLKKLKAQQQRTESRRRSLEGRRARRDELRRKVLVGAVVLARVDQGLLEESVLREWLEGTLERSDDRALFGLDSPAP